MWFNGILMIIGLKKIITDFDLIAEQGYSVVLPEKLQTGKWNVYRYCYLLHSQRLNCLMKLLKNVLFMFCDRSATSPLKLVSRFPDHPEIGTLHDNFV